MMEQISKPLKQVINYSRRHVEDFLVFRRLIDQMYQRRLINHFESLPILDAEDLNIVDHLHKEGVFVTSLDAFDASLASAFLPQATQLKQSLIQTDKPENYRQPYVLATPSQVVQYPETFLFGLNERLLKIAENYLGLPIAYHGMYFHRDFTNALPKKSKLWHRDMEDYRSFKVVLYLSDIFDDAHGPVQYIPKEITKSVVQKIKYRYGYVNDSLMRKHLSGSTWKSCLGGSGTMIFIDTATLFHRGKVPLTTDRFAAFFDYTSRYPKRPYYCKSSLPDNTLKMMAAQVSTYQKNCLLWRQANR